MANYHNKQRGRTDLYDQSLEAATASGGEKSGGGKQKEASSTLGNRVFGPGYTPHIGTHPDGTHWGDVHSGTAPYRGKLNDDIDSSQASQLGEAGETEASVGTSEKKRKVSLFNEPISTR